MSTSGDAPGGDRGETQKLIDTLRTQIDSQKNFLKQMETYLERLEGPATGQDQQHDAPQTLTVQQVEEMFAKRDARIADLADQVAQLKGDYAELDATCDEFHEAITKTLDKLGDLISSNNELREDVNILNNFKLTNSREIKIATDRADDRVAKVLAEIKTARENEQKAVEAEKKMDAKRAASAEANKALFQQSEANSAMVKILMDQKEYVGRGEDVEHLRQENMKLTAMLASDPPDFDGLRNLHKTQLDRANKSQKLDQDVKKYKVELEELSDRHESTDKPETQGFPFKKAI